MLGKMMNKKGGVPKPELPENVSQEALDHGAEVEAGEHTWTTDKQARQIALDHLTECGAGYYEALEKMEKELEEGEDEKDEKENTNA
jgi:hypothetical protein